MKKFVFSIIKQKCFIAYKNSRLRAFTLLEALFSFCLFCLVLSLIPPLFQTVNLLSKQVNDTSLINFEFFAQDITRELNETPLKNIKIQNNHIMVENGKSVTDYTFTREKIYKTINGKGNITLLQNIESYKIKRINNKYIRMDIILIEENQKYYKMLII